MALDLNLGLDIVLTAFCYTEWQTYIGWISEYIVNCDDHSKQETPKTRTGDKPPDPIQIKEVRAETLCEYD